LRIEEILKLFNDLVWELSTVFSTPDSRFSLYNK
jgi:hypothetical protein